MRPVVLEPDRPCDSTDAPACAQRRRAQHRLAHRAPGGGTVGWHNGLRVEATLGPLLPLYLRERAAGRALALGVLVDTVGSTYRKPGALILIAGDGEYAGLISGGCLEGDLCAHGREVIASGTARTVRYDTRTSEDLLFGLGLGCEGAMQILLLQAGPANGWPPPTPLAAAR